jgi:integrase
MALIDAAIRKAKPTAKHRTLADGHGLHLLITPEGRKLWRFRYRFDGKENMLSLGIYPEVSLADARDKRDAARKLVAAGTDPSAKRKAEKEASGATFEAVAREWVDKFKVKWSPGTAEKTLGRLVLHVFPFIGKQVMRTITAPDLLSVIRKVEARGAHETAHRLLRICGQVARYAVSTGKADRDIAHDLKGALAPVVVTNRAAVTDPAKVGALLRVLDGYDGSPIVCAALRLGPLVAVRPGELRRAEWTEIDLDAAMWTVPAWKMKMRSSLTVPLSRQAVAILREIQPLTGSGRYVFPSGRGGDRCMSDNAVLAAMRRCGIPKEEASGHGWRATFRTLGDEVLGFRVDWIEAQLGHAVKDPNGRAYNRTSFLAERTDMLQAWANYLDLLKAGNLAATARA